jgi:uncharacterized protein YjbI with pentapeptide repeats
MSRAELSRVNDPELVAMLERRYVDRHIEARGLDLQGKVLDGADLDGAVLVDSAFDHASLRDVILWSAHPTCSTFVGADLTGVQLVKAQLRDCDFRDARLVRANFLRALGSRLDLRGADLTAANLTRLHLLWSDLRGAVLRDVVLDTTTFQECLLAGVDLRGAAGTLHPDPINVGTPEEPRFLEGDEALAWLRAAGADVTWFVPDLR